MGRSKSTRFIPDQKVTNLGVSYKSVYGICLLSVSHRNDHTYLLTYIVTDALKPSHNALASLNEMQFSLL